MKRLNIVWDFGGVLFRWRPPSLLARILPKHAPDEPAGRALAARFFQGHGGDWNRFDRGLVSADELTDLIAKRTGLRHDEVRSVVDAVPDELRPIDTSVALLRRLRDAGHRLFYLSNMPAPYADHLEREHDFLRWFEDGVFSARVRLAKPDAEIFAAAAARFGAAPGELLFLDDHADNIAAAQSLGWQTLHVTDAAQLAADLKAAGAI